MSSSSTTDIKAKAQDIQNKAQDIKERTSAAIQAQGDKMNQSMENIQNQLQTYGKQIGDYLNNIDAEIHGYRFAVEKTDNGLTVDVLFKATIKTREGQM